MTGRERDLLRAAIDEKRRSLVGAARDFIHHGTHYAYRQQACRCEVCRAFVREAKRRQRQAA